MVDLNKICKDSGQKNIKANIKLVFLWVLFDFLSVNVVGSICVELVLSFHLYVDVYLLESSG